MQYVAVCRTGKSLEKTLAGGKKSNPRKSQAKKVGQCCLELHIFLDLGIDSRENALCHFKQFSCLMEKKLCNAL